MTSTERPTSRLATESLATLSMPIGASVRVHGSHSAPERHCEKRQLFDPAHALQMILHGVEALTDGAKAAICDTAGCVTVEDIRSPSPSRVSTILRWTVMGSILMTWKQTAQPGCRSSIASRLADR
jgi:hypothetical protein